MINIKYEAINFGQKFNKYIFLKLIKIYLMMRDKNKKNIFIEKKT